MSDDGSQSQPGGEAAAGNPMAMGMAIARKMMGGMGQGGPFEMMQKMMGQMTPASGKPPMEEMIGMCMGMCAEMLNAIKQTNALAVHATPELQKAFAEWLKATEDKVMDLIADNTTDATAIAAALGVSEASARYVLMRLAEGGRVMLSVKAAK